MRKLITICVVMAMMSIVSSSHAVLQNWGSDGKYFYDTDTGLYWWDPVEFVGQSYSDIDAFVTANPAWKWASSAEIDALAGKSSQGGVPLTDVMGPHQYQTGCLSGDVWYDGSRWIGYYDNSPAQPDGWLVQTVLDCSTTPVLDDPSTLGETGFQNYVGGWPHGAWINSRIPPESEHSFLIGTWVNIDQTSGGIAAFAIFEDQAGDLLIYTLGQCSPYCEWGVVPCIGYSDNVGSSLMTGFMAFYDMGFVEIWMAATRIDFPEIPVLQVTHFNFFFDSRHDYWMSEIFVRIN